MSKILVTGSCGLLGSHLVNRLIDDGHTVLGIDNLSTGYRTNADQRADNLFLDLFSDPKEVSHAIESFSPEYVYHTAAWAHEGLSSFCPIHITNNNYNATLNTLIPSIRCGVKRFVFFSSMSVYGEQEPPFDEQMSASPVDVYGISKAASEKAIEQLSKVHDFDYTIIRPHNIIGVRQNLSDPYRNVAGIFIRRALEGRNLVIYGDGEQKRAFSDVEDVIPHIMRSAFEPRASKQIINIGPIEEFTVNQLADKVIALSGKDLRKEYLPERPLEVKYAWCTNDKARDTLGYETTVTFDEGMEKMWNWAKHLSETTGIAKPRYMDQLELEGDKLPETWRNKTL